MPLSRLTLPRLNGIQQVWSTINIQEISKARFLVIQLHYCTVITIALLHYYRPINYYQDFKIALQKPVKHQKSKF